MEITNLMTVVGNLEVEADTKCGAWAKKTVQSPR